MNHRELSGYVVELEEALYEHDLNETAMHAELPKIHQVIECLIELTFSATESSDKVMLAMLELKARKMRDYMISHLQTKN